MIDIISVMIGMIIVFAILFVGILIMDLLGNTSQNITVFDPATANDIVGKTPKCPDCNSYDLTLVDNCDGVPWLKGHTTEIDYYQCNDCGRRFNDEDWESAKKFTDLGDSE